MANQQEFLDGVTVTSLTGVGGSSACREFLKLAPEYDHVSGSIIMTRMRPVGMSKKDFALWNTEHPEANMDERCDDELERAGRRNKILLEGRFPHCLAPWYDHILLVCEDVWLRAKRRHAEILRKDPQSKETVESVLREILARDETDDKRYKIIRPGSNWLPGQFDKVIDTKEHGEIEVGRIIFDHHQQWKSEKKNKLVSELSFCATT